MKGWVGLVGWPAVDGLPSCCQNFIWVTFKIAILVFQCLTGQAPMYPADDCQLTSDVRTRRLRSTYTAMCVVRRSNNTFGGRCFASAGPRLWNRLPAHLRQCDSHGQFKRLLKTHVFGSWDCGALWHFCYSYLLTWSLSCQVNEMSLIELIWLWKSVAADVGIQVLLP